MNTSTLIRINLKRTNHFRKEGEWIVESLDDIFFLPKEDIFRATNDSMSGRSTFLFLHLFFYSFHLPFGFLSSLSLDGLKSDRMTFMYLQRQREFTSGRVGCIC